MGFIKMDLYSGRSAINGFANVSLAQICKIKKEQLFTLPL
jgi:hypothetical protein